MADIDVKELAAQLAEAVRVSLKEDLDEIKGEIKGVKSRLDKVESRLDGVESRLDNIESRLDTVESEVKSTRSAVIDLGNDLRKQERVTNNLILDVYRLKSEQEKQ
ncbi:hypothetical protein [Laceyella putida]|uniref:Uncharacterized protein n=1 Tax=Laceyella putida TaxID=110101 RepID=A0ABW2RNZ2_9BACL